MHDNDARLVLVVEDERDVREGLVAILGGEGYRAAGAVNGEHALRLLRAERVRPHLILLDLMMPVMDGPAFRAEQMADTALAEIPVIVMSAHSALRQHAQALHVTAYLQKPVDIDGLLDVIRRHC